MGKVFLLHLFEGFQERECVVRCMSVLAQFINKLALSRDVLLANRNVASAISRSVSERILEYARRGDRFQHDANGIDSSRFDDSPQSTLRLPAVGLTQGAGFRFALGAGALSDRPRGDRAAHPLTADAARRRPTNLGHADQLLVDAQSATRINENRRY